MSTNTNEQTAVTPAEKVKNDAWELLEYWKKEYNRVRRKFEADVKTYAYLGAASRFDEVLRAEAALGDPASLKVTVEA